MEKLKKKEKEDEDKSIKVLKELENVKVSLAKLIAKKLQIIKYKEI